MNRLIHFILLLFAFTNCKKDERDPVALLASLTGIWRPVERTSPDFVTVAVTNAEPDILEFRFDGVILNRNGFRSCCTPNSYTVNGVYLNITPPLPAELDPLCIAASCVSCQDLHVIQNKPDELTMYCNGNATKFIREK
ncbi:hypothetical protein [Dyadobacter sediminis]|uniref:META domain-containing protein n=1 Tax=Dyadobacter sediminis TaxID=1493691 RepID=A0A5R9KB69_9BACT|nr:hypothetical protein [Dyadobacter sediminis]TLU92061.1 hypothetical protein FEM55_15030 [Dyadobacter sediminis]